MAGTKFKSRNLNRFRKIYPGIRKKPVNVSMSDKAVTIEEAIVSFSNESSKTYTFTASYDSVPSVNLIADDDVNVFITAISTSSVTIGTSSNITGNVHVQILKVG